MPGSIMPADAAEALDKLVQAGYGDWVNKKPDEPDEEPHEEAHEDPHEDPHEPVPLVNRVRASEARKIKAGGRRMPGGVMPADAAEALDKLVSHGYGNSTSGCIFRAIIEAAERIQ